MEDDPVLAAEPESGGEPQVELNKGSQNGWGRLLMWTGNEGKE